MEEVMTDRQLEFIVNIVLDKFEKCKDMKEVSTAINEVKEMIKKDKSKERE